MSGDPVTTSADFAGVVITPEEHVAVVRLIEWVDANVEVGVHVPRSVRDGVETLARLRPKPEQDGHR